MIRRTSVAMTVDLEGALRAHLVRGDGQEDLCLATYRPSTGTLRSTALIRSVVPPEPGERYVHGNATITGDYVLRASRVAQEDGCGLVLLHSHPAGRGWQPMSTPDRDCESSYANLVRQITGFPLVGMTLASGDHTWSARHWDVGVGQHVDCTHCSNVRVIGDRLAVSWNDAVCPPPRSTGRQIRTVSAWGDECQADLARRRVLVVGAGSVGLDVAIRLAASGLGHVTIMDFDIVEELNLDRLVGARRRDTRLRRPKIHVARREVEAAATAAQGTIEVSDRSICEPDGLGLALDHDLIFSCVDRPWPRAVLNSLAYSDLIPVIDGGIAIDTFEDGTMRNATWRSHVVRPGRPCTACNGQLDVGSVTADRQGLFEDPSYITGAGYAVVPAGQNVAPLSISVAAGLLAQYVSLSIGPAGFGEPGPLQYALSTHQLDRLECGTKPHCSVEAGEGVGDLRVELTGRHELAEQQRLFAKSVSIRTRFLRWVDDSVYSVTARLDRRRS